MTHESNFEYSKNQKFDIFCLEDRLCVERVQDNGKTKSGLYIGETKEGQSIGIIRHLSRELLEGSLFKKDQLVLFSRYNGIEINLNEANLIFLKKNDVIAILGPQEEGI